MNSSTYTDAALGSRIRHIRQTRGELLADMAHELGISASLMSRIETGRRRPSEGLLNRIASHFDVPVDRLMLASERVSGGVTWPITFTGHPHECLDSLALADMALAATLAHALDTLASEEPAERYRACRQLARAASRPLEALSRVAADDRDPLVRQAADQLIKSLSEAYCTPESH